MTTTDPGTAQLTVSPGTHPTADRGALLWEPPLDARRSTRVGRFLDRVEARRGRHLSSYRDAHAWSVSDLEGFWTEVVTEFDVAFVDAPTAVLDDAPMPATRWFPGATLNYAAQALRWTGDEPAIVARSQSRSDATVTRDELRDLVARAAAGLRRLGVRPGDRVVGYLPNVPETVVAFLACAAIGAVWASCAPEFGAASVLQRVRQLEPTVLLAVDGYRYGRKRIDRSAVVDEIRAGLPSLRATVVLGCRSPAPDLVARADLLAWEDLLAEPAELDVLPVAFDHPLYVLFSSGTTGPPKAIVHGHGGIVVEHLKNHAFVHDLDEGDVFFWFTTTGWMMWNYLVSGLLLGATIVTFDGDPGHPDPLALWRLAADTDCAVFGVGAQFLMNGRRAGLQPGRDLDLSSLRSVGSTASPLPADGYAWVYDQVGADLLLSSSSGGTDVCTSFVAGSPLLPVHAGEIPGPCLGVDVRALDEAGREVVGRRGELVIARPMPSMPVGFWDDPDGQAYHRAYFADYPGVWCHGDWVEVVEERSTLVITGRSDATLNRGGVRMGTSEFYAVVDEVDGVVDSLVVHRDGDGDGPGQLLLFVVAEDDLDANGREQLRTRLAGVVRGSLSPRHVPDAIHLVSAVPRTSSGKRMEVPTKRILQGEPMEQVARSASARDLAAFREIAAVTGA